MGSFKEMILVVGAHLFFLIGAYYFEKNAEQSKVLRKNIVIRFRRAVWGGVISAPLVIYVFITFSIDPFLKNWTAQNLILSPHPLHYLVAYGLLIPFFIVGGWKMFSSGLYQQWLPVIWGIMVPLLVYLPYNLQRRLPEGGWVAITAVALYAFENQNNTSKSKVTTFKFSPNWIWLFVLLLPSTLILLATGLFAARTKIPPVFLSRNEVEVYNYLGSQAHPGDVVLASYDTGNNIPAWVPVRVVVGHGPESVHLSETLPIVESFYSKETNDTQRIFLLEKYHVKYVIWGDSERQYGQWDPQKASFLQLLRVFGGTAIFSSEKH